MSAVVSRRTELRGHGDAGRAQPWSYIKRQPLVFQIRALQGIAGPGHESLSGPSSWLLEVMSWLASSEVEFRLLKLIPEYINHIWIGQLNQHLMSA